MVKGRNYDQYAFNAKPDFIKYVDKFIKNNKVRYKDRTQFILLAMEEKIERERCDG